ncbi:MAG: ABC transporter substrate-binding protein [Eubacteriales bacterium]|nr:ABC transporter substrate-binding protein [Christensenellaceae bacterium]MEA5067341.1 ABC transporter substrate-binding protein [Eubacteriales bacterium]
MKKLGSLLLVMLLMATALTPFAAAEAPEKVLRFATSSIKGAFNPILSDDVYDDYICKLMFVALASSDPGNNVIFDENCVAEGYELSDDHLTYTFKLKPDLKFSSGDPITAEDVEFTWKMMGDPKYDGPRSPQAADILGFEAYNKGETDVFEGIKVIDEHTISFTLTEPYVAKIEQFSEYGIMSKKYYEKENYEDFKALNATPMGAGPFILDSFDPGQAANLVRNPNWWGKQPKLDGVTVLCVPPESQIMALTSGQCDLIEAPASNQDSYDGIVDGGAKVIQFIGLGYNCIMLNHQSPKLSDVRVRKALMHGFDRAGFIENEYEGFAKPCTMLVYDNPEFWAYPKDHADQLDSYPFDQEKAKALLDEAGWVDSDGDGIREKDGVKLELTMFIYNEAPWPGNLSALLVEQWPQIGVGLTVMTGDFNSIMDDAYDNRAFDKFDMWTQGWQLSSDPDSSDLVGKAASAPGGYNPGGYYNEKAEELFKAGRQEFDMEKRAAIYAEWALLSNDDLPMLYNAVRDQLWGVAANVTGFEEMNPFYNWVKCIYDVDIAA